MIMRRSGKIILPALLISLLLLCSVSMAADTDIPEYYFEGKDGWYFSDFNGNTENYRGTNLFTIQQLDRIKKGFEILRDKLAAEDIRLVIMLAPTKETIYSEYMPDSFGPPAPFNRLMQLFMTLSGDLDVICPEVELQVAKADWPEYNFYYKTDIHWNYLGGYVGAKMLLSELGIYLPDLEDVTIYSREVEPFSRDEIEGKEEADKVYETEYTVSFPDARWGYMTDVVDEGEKYRYHTEKSTGETMCYIGDSFSIAMDPYMGQGFSDIYVHHLNIDANETLEEIFDEEPSVVVFEACEIFFDHMLTFADELIAGD